MKNGEARSELDHELIAGLVEGRLGKKDRRRALDLLAESPEAYDVYVEASAVFAEIAGDGDQVRAVQSHRGHQPRQASWPTRLHPSRRRWLAAAAVAVLLGTAFARWARPTDTGTLLIRAAGDAEYGALAEAWTAVAWQSTRSTPAEMVVGLTAEQLQFRMGLRLVDATVAVLNEDRAALVRVLVELPAYADAAMPESPLVEEYADLTRFAERGGTFSEISLRLNSSISAVARAVDSSHFLLGAWVAIARITLDSGRQIDTRARPARALLGRVDRAALSPEVRGGLERVQSLAERNDDAVRAETRAAIDALIRDAGG